MQQENTETTTVDTTAQTSSNGSGEITTQDAQSQSGKVEPQNTDYWPHLELIKEEDLNVSDLPKEIRSEIQMFAAQMGRKNKSDKMRVMMKKKSVVIADMIQDFIEKDLPDEEQNSAIASTENNQANTNQTTPVADDTTTPAANSQHQTGQTTTAEGADGKKEGEGDNEEGVERKRRPMLIGRRFDRPNISRKTEDGEDGGQGEDDERPIRRPLRRPITQTRTEPVKPVKKEPTKEELILQNLDANRRIHYKKLCEIMGVKSIGWTLKLDGIACQNIYMTNDYVVTVTKK